MFRRTHPTPLFIETASGSITIHGNRIQAVDALSPPPQAHRIEQKTGYLYPGLINSHDHLEFNLFPRLGSPPYPNSYQWGLEITQRKRSPVIDPVLAVPLPVRLYWGALKNVLSGVTTVVHHGEYHTEFNRPDFPVEVFAPYGWAHSLKFETNVEAKYRATPPEVPFFIHLAEGTDAETAAELVQLDQLGALGKNTVIIHGINLSENDIRTLQMNGRGLVWCPASNQFLFGQTAPIAALRAAGVPLALGSDSTLSGSPTLLDELRWAQQLSGWTETDLLDLVTTAPATLLCRPELGRFAPDNPANVLLTRAPLLDCMPHDICLLIRNGQPVYGDPEFAELFSGKISRFTIHGVEKILQGDMKKMLRKIDVPLTLPVKVC